MNKINKILAGVFIAGVITCGIGAGIAIVEYSNLEYTGIHILGEEYLKTEQLEIEVEPEENKRLMLNCGYRTNEITYDENVPENIIRYEITYNSNIAAPRLYFNEYDSDEIQGMVVIHNNGYFNDFDVFMRNKDYILKELKNNKIGTYTVQQITDIKISVNPQMKDYVVLEY